MSLALRIILIVGATLTLAFFVYQIRKKRLQIDYALFWIVFSAILLVIAIFPSIITVTADFLGILSPANLVFLVIIFLLILRLFSITQKLSQTNEQLTRLAQRLALLENSRESKKESTDVER